MKQFALVILFALALGNLNAQSGNTDSLFNDEIRKVKLIEDVEKKEIAYRELLARFSESGEASRATHYRRLRTSLAVMWSSNGNASKAIEYYNQVKESLGFGIGVTIGSNLIQNKSYSVGLAILGDVMPEVMASFEKGETTFYDLACDPYAQALFYLGRKDDALKFARQAYEKSNKKNALLNSTYAMILNDRGLHSEAIPIMQQLVSDGMATAEIKKLFRQSFIKESGNEKSFDKLMSDLSIQLKKKMEHEAEAKLIDEAPFPFSLRDMDGNTVSLSEMKGKVVILDFWATWCIPCIRSMPAMQQAANIYKNDPKVKFLFIDTGETIPDFESAVKKIMKENKYDFQVLYDMKDPKNNKWAVLTGFKVNALPTKLVLDGNGRVRYRLIGDGGFDAVVAELTAMIEKVKICKR